MKEWFLDLWLWFDLVVFGHDHKYSMVSMTIYKGKEREHPSGIPITGWIYRCKCGEEIIELDRPGIRLLQKGIDYDEIIKKRI